MCRFKPKFSDEEKAEHFRIGRQYQINHRKRQNAMEKDLTNKIWLQHEALRSLPEKLRIAAEIIDETPPPPNRPWPVFDTPPIEGFDPKLYQPDAGDEEEM